jgi:hypothetical protein
VKKRSGLHTQDSFSENSPHVLAVLRSAKDNTAFTIRKAVSWKAREEERRVACSLFSRLIPGRVDPD